MGMALLYGFPAAGGDGDMAGYAPTKTKRKVPEEVYDEFSEFSLSSPARKIRRLDAELTPIMEEEERVVPRVFGQPLPEEQFQSCLQKMPGGLTESEPSVKLNEERAIVLYKPVYSPIADLPSSSDVFLKLQPDVIAGFKDRGFWSGQANKVEIREVEEEAPTDDRQAASSNCLAVVPWVPSQSSRDAYSAGVTGGMSELAEDQWMVSEDVEAASMDIEEEGGHLSGTVAHDNGMVVTQGFQHWQQHCMMPQISPSNSTPIMWSWG